MRQQMRFTGLLPGYDPSEPHGTASEGDLG
ncbi:hypothetical protein ABIA33_005652 [Streptacidiphilus sp. MAP12-16]